MPGDAKASAGSGGVANGCTTGWVYLTNTSCVDGQVRKSPRHDRPHNSWHQANRCAQCGKSARWVRCGGGWKRIHGSAIEALPTETGSNKLGQTFGTPRQSSTRLPSVYPDRMMRYSDIGLEWLHKRCCWPEVALGEACQALTF